MERRTGPRINPSPFHDAGPHRIRAEMPEKAQGYAVSIKVTGKLFRKAEPAWLEIVFLDPENDEVAFRRVSDALEGKEKGEWLIGPLEEALEEALAWKEEVDSMKEPVRRSGRRNSSNYFAHAAEPVRRPKILLPVLWKS